LKWVKTLYSLPISPHACRLNNVLRADLSKLVDQVSKNCSLSLLAKKTLSFFFLGYYLFLLSKFRFMDSAVSEPTSNLEESVSPSARITMDKYEDGPFDYRWQIAIKFRRMILTINPESRWQELKISGHSLQILCNKLELLRYDPDPCW
jgi:hypothetical protein